MPIKVAARSLCLCLAAIAAATTLTRLVQSQTNGDETGNNTSSFRFRHNGSVHPENPSGSPTEAPTGFDNVTNGFLTQGPPFERINADNVVSRRSFNDNRFLFEEIETAEDGLGPTCRRRFVPACDSSPGMKMRYSSNTE